MNSLRSLALTLITLALFAYPAHAAVTWQTIDVPGATLTALADINSTGDMVGVYQDNTGAKSFLLSGGVVTIIQYPGSNATTAKAINDCGDIAGSYETTGDNLNHGFLLQGQTYTTIDVPGAAHTYILGMNNLQDLVGMYVDFSSKTHGFARIGGTFTTIEVPNAKSTTLYGINDTGDIVGTSVIGHLSMTRAFVLTHGHYQHLRITGVAQMYATAINNRKQVVGFAIYDDGSIRGFAFFNGQYTILTEPGSKQDVTAYGVNDNGDIVGPYVDANNVEHGFLRTQ